MKKADAGGDASRSSSSLLLGGTMRKKAAASTSELLSGKCEQTSADQIENSRPRHSKVTDTRGQLGSEPVGLTRLERRSSLRRRRCLRRRHCRCR